MVGNYGSVSEINIMSHQWKSVIGASPPILSVVNHHPVAILPSVRHVKSSQLNCYVEYKSG